MSEREVSSCAHHWVQVESGEDRREADGRTRWYTSYRCDKCGDSKLTKTEWERI
jgi:hypothetical protein